MVWWIHIEAHDVAHLIDKLWIGRNLERLGAVRFQAERPPDVPNRRVTHSDLLRHLPRAPMSPALWRRLQRLGHHRFDLFV